MKRAAWLQDPLVPSLVLFGSMIVAGFAAIFVGWSVAARTLVVSSQTPALVSGGLGGLLLVCVGSSLMSVQIRRRFAAAEHAEMDRVLEEAVALVASAKTQRNRTRG